jgi:hypothetical protein
LDFHSGSVGRLAESLTGSTPSGDRAGPRVADTDKPLGHYPRLWICRVCGDFIWPLSSPSGSAARSDRGIALRITALLARPSDSRPQVECSNDPPIRLMRHFNIPVTRENYLDLEYMGQAPDPLGAEEGAGLEIHST